MAEYNSREIAAAIMGGEFDDELSLIRAACDDRKEYLGNLKIWSFAVGDRVVFNDNTRPVYLQGLEATIQKINRKTVVVDLDAPARRFFKQIRTHTSLIERIEENA